MADVEGARRALQDVLSDDRLRAEIASRGLVRARAFSWAIIAEQMADLLTKSPRR